jgi:hypothetical protein
MILYTIVDPNYVFGNGMQSEEYKDLPRLIETCIDGVMVECQQLEKDTLRVERILSTNPKDFLKPNLQPGTNLRL